MRILHQPLVSDRVDLAWTLRTAPARFGAILVLCGSMLVSFTSDPPARAETERGAAHRLAPRKAAGDFLVKGNAVPIPSALGSRNATRVAIALNGRRKELAVFGDRNWSMGALGLAATEPEPFESMPITWDRAFGGPGEARNPAGRGFGPGLRGKQLPNVEYLDNRVTQPTSRPEPAGIGPLDAQWQPRLGKLGTFDDAWLAGNWPMMPDDFDAGYWNEAPADQQYPEFFRGDERLAFENMRADAPDLQMQLPGLRARAFGELTNGRTGEIRMVLDTIDVDVDAGQAELVWRGSLPVRSPRCKELAFLFTLTEPLDAPADEEGWRAMFLVARQTHYPTPAERAEAAETARVAREAKVAAHEARMEAIRAPALAAIADARAQAASGGRIPAEPAPPDPAAIRKALEAAYAQAREKRPDKVGELDAALAKLLSAQDRIARRQEKWTRERVIAAHQGKADLSDADLSNLDLSGLDFRGGRFGRAKFANANLGGSVWCGADLTGCDFTDVDAAHADFSGANLTESVFSKATLTLAIFSDAALGRASFRHAAGAGAVFDRAHGGNVQFDEASLQGARFHSARLPRASFAMARIDQVTFDNAVLTKADFPKAVGEQVSFRGADLGNLRAPEAMLPGATLTGASALRSVWRMAHLAGADFARAKLTRAIFAEAELERAIFDRAVLVDANFDDALMQFSVLTNANALRTSFTRTDLRDVDMRGANLYMAGLFGARAARARLDGSFLAGTLLAS